MEHKKESGVYIYYNVKCTAFIFLNNGSNIITWLSNLPNLTNKFGTLSSVVIE